jgi:hypothetical protein
MALALNDRVQQTGTANTTVSFTLTGAVQGFQSFAVVGNGNTTYYGAFDPAGNWEVGVGTYSTTGPTLTRTTILSSSNSGTAVTFSGPVNVFVTYPSEKSVNLDGSDNVSALGTVSSGTWQGTTVGVAYGGTGVTSSSGANSVMLRDANQNVAVNRLNQSNTAVSAAGGTTALTAASSYSQTLNGTGNQTYTMPDATTLTTGVAFVFNNNATGTLTLQNYTAGSIGIITSGGAAELVLLANGTTAGTWDVHGFLPEAVTWGTNALDLGSTVITNGTWNGGTIQSGYGGTGLTTFTGANNALYSTSSSALVAGTLPIAAGGTGSTSTTYCNLTSNVTGNLPVTNLNSGTGATSGTYWRGDGTWAAAVSSAASYTRTSFNVSGPTTVFTVAYTVGYVEVYVNGVLLSASDYTASNGTSVTLATTAISGDVVEFIAFTTGSVIQLPISLTSEVTGVLPIANGGTGAASLTGYGALVMNSAGTAATSVAPGTVGNLLTSNGTSWASSAPPTSMVYPGAGIPNSTGTAWGTSYSTTGSGTVVALATSPTLVTPILGTPSSGTLTSCTGLPISTGVSGLGTNVATALAVAVGSAGAVVVNGGALGTPSSGTLTNCTFPTLNQNTTGSAATFTSTSQNSQFNSIGVGTAGSGTAGEIRATNNVTAFYSDERLKTKTGNIENALDKVCQIETMLYHANEIAVALGYDASIPEVGVTAQSVQKVQPEIVVPAPIDAKYLTVRYEKLIPLLIEAIKELNNKIKALQ